MKQTVFAAVASIAAVIILCLITPDAKSQVVKDAAGNYTISKKPVSDTAASKTKKPPRDTGHTITDEEGKVYKVYEGSRGGLFYLKPGTDGTPKKIYIKK